MADRFTVVINIVPVHDFKTFDAAREYLEEYMLAHRETRAYVVKVVATLEAKADHKLTLHERGLTRKSG